MALGDGVRSALKRYARYSLGVQRAIVEVQREATEAAIRVATENTPHEGDGKTRGLNQITNNAYLSWERDSKAVPINFGSDYVTSLVNTQPYISFINDGHFQDMHFVPHLFPNASTGLLDKIPEQSGGIVVGTQTEYIAGLYMKDLAIDEFRRIVNEKLGRGVITYIVSSSTI